MSSKPNLKSWLPALLRQVVGQLRLDLRLRPDRRERVPARAGLRVVRTVDRRDIRRGAARIDRGHHRPGERESADVDVEEQAVAQHRLPLGLVHLRPAVLRENRLRRDQRRQTAERLLFPPGLEVADDRVVGVRLDGALGGVVVELAEVGRDALRDAGHLLVDLELVVGAVEPDLVLLDRTAEIGVPFPEQQVRVVALLHARAVRRTGVAARRHVGRRRIAADEAARLVGEVLEPFELVAAALDRRHDRGAGRVHLDVAAERAHRHFFVGEVVLVEAGAADAFGVVDAVGDDPRLVLHAEALVAGLLALVAAADVEALHADAGRFRQRAPRVGGVGNAGERFALQTGADLGRRHVDDRRRAGDGDALGQRGQRQLGVDRNRLARAPR